MKKLNVGDKAPLLPINYDALKGKKIVLYFYPKDNTPGCTEEACNIRDNFTGLKDAGYEVFGVSANDEKSHQKFIEKYQLPFTLLADTDKKICNDYGVWGEKSMYGKKYEGIFRTTFIINSEGIIEKIIDKVKTKDHTTQILQ